MITLLGYVLFIIALFFALYFRREALFFKSQWRRERAIRVNAAAAIGAIGILASWLIACYLDGPKKK